MFTCKYNLLDRNQLISQFQEMAQEERDMDIIKGNVEAIFESVNKNGSKQYQICVRDSMQKIHLLSSFSEIKVSLI